MISSSPLGTILRQRYLIQQVLGQGGFGRTYLAIDQERFNELCVIKEFTVPYQDQGLIEKAKILFQREAATLYQIQHPQIPRFWAAFEEDQRLFLVQDFVQGETYRSLLQTRKTANQAFSESEVVHLLNHLLPILSYLHDRGIIHRDISPENIILRVVSDVQRPLFEPVVATNPFPASGLPTLIDFGAVKEAASHWPIVSTLTRVGKVGYAPPEQLQTGNAFPHSDLYALAATSLVLLTGREPQALLNSQTLAWQWQPYAQMSSLLASVLQRMLSLQPAERYPNAAAVLADLQPILATFPSEITLSPLVEPVTRLTAMEIGPAARDHNLSTPSPLMPRSHSSDHKLGVPSERSLQVSSTLIAPLKRTKTAKYGPPAAIVASLLATLSLGAHLFIFKGTTAFNSSQAIQASNGNPIILPIPAQLNNNTGQPQEIKFAPGEISSVEQGNLQDNTSQLYILKAAQGQIMSASLEGSGVVMNLLRSDQQAIDSASYQTRSWTGQLPADDEYLIQVSGSGTYSIDVTISPLSRVEPALAERVKFPQGKSGTTVTGEVHAKQQRKYLLEAKRGQVMALKVLHGNVSLSVIAPNGQQIGGSSSTTNDWKGGLPIAGEYVVEVSATKLQDFAISFEIF